MPRDVALPRLLSKKKEYVFEGKLIYPKVLAITSVPPGKRFLQAELDMARVLVWLMVKEVVHILLSA